MTHTPEKVALKTCGVCGENEAFTGTCGGGRENSNALCFGAAQGARPPGEGALRMNDLDHPPGERNEKVHRAGTAP